MTIPSNLPSISEKLFGAHEIQRFNRDADETIAWINEKDALISSDDCGKDLASVQTLQRKHEVSNAIRNPNRPICWSMKRTDGTLGDTLTRYQYPLGASAYIEGIKISVMEEADVRGLDSQFSVKAYPPTTQGAYYLASIRPKTNVKSSDGVTDIDNHSLYQPTGVTISALDENNALVAGELRIFSRCLIKNENWEDISFTNLQQDRYGFHEGHGPEIFRKAFQGFGEIDFTKVFKTIQNGSIKPNAEKDSAQRKQQISTIDASGSKVRLTVKNNPLNGSNTHLFEDRTPVEFSGLTVDGPTNLNGNTYYLSIDSSSRAFLYSNTTDFDDDRTCRVINYSSLTGSLAEGETITLGANTCVIVKFDGSQIKVQNRSADIDAYVGAGSSSGGATFNVASIGLANTTNDDDAIDYLWPKDHYTTYSALTNAGWANTSETPTAAFIEGNPPKVPVWTFMWAPFVAPTAVTGVHDVHLNINWKERLQ